MSKLTKVEMGELVSLALDGSEKFTDVFGASVHTVHMIAKAIPPVAILLEGIASVVEIIEDRSEKTHLTKVDKGAQILVASLVISAAVVGFASLAVAALSPAMPFVYGVAAGLLAVTALHRIFMVKGDPAYQTLRGEKKELKTVYKQLLDDDNLSPEIKSNLQERMKGGEVTADIGIENQNIKKFLGKLEAFKQKRGEYKEFRAELRHLKAKVVLHSAFFTTMAVLSVIAAVGAVANPIGAPIALGLVAVSYFAYRLGLAAKIKKWARSIFTNKSAAKEGQPQSEDNKMRVENELTDKPSDAAQQSDNNQALGPQGGNDVRLKKDSEPVGSERQGLAVDGEVPKGDGRQRASQPAFMQGQDARPEIHTRKPLPQLVDAARAVKEEGDTSLTREAEAGSNLTQARPSSAPEVNKEEEQEEVSRGSSFHN